MYLERNSKNEPINIIWLLQKKTWWNKYNCICHQNCKPKTVKTKYGNILVKTPRDRNATFEPIIIEKGQTRLTGFEDKCIALYAKGLSLRDIEKALNEIYGVKINKDDISKLIAAVSEEVESWRNRTLKPMYVFTYADCLYIPIKDDITSSKKAVYIIIGVDVEGYKDILGLWIDKTESAESVNSALRKVTRGKGTFPSESAVYKVLYLRIKELSLKWNKPIKNWITIRKQLISLFRW